MCIFEVIETDDSFKPLKDGYDYLVDFMDLSFPTKRPDREHSYVEVRHSTVWLPVTFKGNYLKDT